MLVILNKLRYQRTVYSFLLDLLDLLDYIGAVRRNDVIIITTDSPFYAF